MITAALGSPVTLAATWLSLGLGAGWLLGRWSVWVLLRPLPSPWPLLRAACAAHLEAQYRLAEVRRAEWEATRRRYG